MNISYFNAWMILQSLVLAGGVLNCDGAKFGGRGALYWKPLPYALERYDCPWCVPRFRFCIGTKCRAWPISFFRGGRHCKTAGGGLANCATFIVWCVRWSWASWCGGAFDVAGVTLCKTLCRDVSNRINGSCRGFRSSCASMFSFEISRVPRFLTTALLGRELGWQGEGLKYETQIEFAWR